MDRNYQTLERPSELEAKQQAAAGFQDRAAAYQEGYRRGMESMSPGIMNAGMAYTANECSDKPYHPSTVLERIEKELSAHAQESRRVVKLEALRQLLAANPDVARILELKAELGL